MAWESKAFFYTRTSNPTTDALEEKVAALEGAEAAVACASGMAAVANTIFSLLGEGDHCVASEDVFIITRFFLDDVCAPRGSRCRRVDTTDLEAVRAALRPRRRPFSSSPSRIRTCGSRTSPRSRRSPAMPAPPSWSTTPSSRPPLPAARARRRPRAALRDEVDGRSRRRRRRRHRRPRGTSSTRSGQLDALGGASAHSTPGCHARHADAPLRMGAPSRERSRRRTSCSARRPEVRPGPVPRPRHRTRITYLAVITAPETASAG